MMAGIGRIRRLMAVAVAAGLLAGCAGKGPKPAPLPDFDPTAKTRVAWRAHVGDSGRYAFSPLYLDDAVYAASIDGDLLKLSADRGRTVWRIDAGEELSGGVGAAGNIVLVGTAEGAVLAFDTDGKRLWRSQVSSEVLSAPAGTGDIVVVRSGDSRVFGLDAKDGSRLWEYQGPTPPLTLRAVPGLVVVENAVVGGFPGGKLIVLGLRNGALLWETSVAVPRGDNELERIADIAGTPLVEADRICAVTYQGKVGCYETERGTQLWSRPASSAGSLGADPATIYYSEENGDVVALDKATGASMWRQEKLYARGVSAPLAFGDYVVVGDFKGFLHFLNKEDGAFAARRRTDGSPILAQPVALGERVLVQTDRGGLYAIEFR
ncbi:MAG: outer membrane protein assembly factor BamB [Burkholderiales bacterium]